MALRAILFDVDGTLVDTVDLHARAWQEALARYGRQVKLEQVRVLVGKGAEEIVRAFLRGEDLERWGEDVVRFHRELYRERYLPQAQPFPGVLELFQRIKRDGRLIVLASSSHAPEVQHYIQLLGVADLIDGTVTHEDVAHAKPAPDLFVVALRKVHAETSEALVVGDSAHDAEAARPLAIRTVGLLCGAYAEPALRAAGAEAVYKTPLDLLMHYEQSPLAPAVVCPPVSAGPLSGP